MQDENGLLQVVMTTEGGNPISEPSLRQIAMLAGSAVGYASVLHQDKIVGHQEGCFLAGVPFKKGHLASLILVNEKEVIDATTFLRRSKVDNHPDYNQMETDLKIKKIIWDSYGYLNPEEEKEDAPGISSLSSQGINLGIGSSSTIDEFYGAKMKLNRNTLEFDNIYSEYKSIGKLKITSGHFKEDATVTSPSILMESAGSVPGSISLIADTRPSI